VWKTPINPSCDKSEPCSDLEAKTLQKFASVHSSIHNYFNLERQLTDRQTFKLNQTAALEEWRQFAT
jgi:putative transposase